MNGYGKCVCDPTEGPSSKTAGVEPWQTVSYIGSGGVKHNATGIKPFFGLPGDISVAYELGYDPGLDTGLTGTKSFLKCSNETWTVDLMRNSQIWQLDVSGTPSGGSPKTATGTVDFSLDPTTGVQILFKEDLFYTQNFPHILVTGTSGISAQFLTAGLFPIFYYPPNFYSQFNFQSFGVTGNCANVASGVKIGQLTFAGSLSDIPPQDIYGTSGDSVTATLTGTQWS